MEINKVILIQNKKVKKDPTIKQKNKLPKQLNKNNKMKKMKKMKFKKKNKKIKNKQIQNKNPKKNII